jgi:hypothetical protein
MCRSSNLSGRHLGTVSTATPDGDNQSAPVQYHGELQQQASAGATSATSSVQQAHEQLLAALRHAINASFGYKRVWVGKSFPWWTRELADAV